MHVTFSTVCLAQRTAYPEPPLDFKYSPNLDSLCYRYENYLKHKETITGMGYFCLSLLEWESGGRKKTSLKYSIEYGLLKKLGELTSTKGDLREARKLELKKDAKPVALSDAERTWIVEVVRRIILRKGEYDFDPKAKLKTITLEDFLKI